MSNEMKQGISRPKTVIIYAPESPQDKERLNDIVRECIDLFWNKKKLSIPECAYVLDELVGGFEATITMLSPEERKKYADRKAERGQP